MDYYYITTAPPLSSKVTSGVGRVFSKLAQVKKDRATVRRAECMVSEPGVQPSMPFELCGQREMSQAKPLRHPGHPEPSS